jgi:carboxyl-terminal processing protease
VLAVNLFFGAGVRPPADDAGKNDVYRNLRLFTLVLERVRQDYVDGEKLTYQDLVYGALKGMLSTLDPHSEFLDPRKYHDFKDDTEGAYGGVGLVINLIEERLTVVSVMDDSPSARAGIRPGEQITRIGDRNAERMTAGDAVNLLRGTPGTEVRLALEQPDTGVTKEHTLKREVIKVETVTDQRGTRVRAGEDRIGYLRLSQLGAERGEVESAVRAGRAGDAGLDRDLRGNPGSPRPGRQGLQPLPATQDPGGHHRRARSVRTPRVPRSRPGRDYQFPLVILVNEGSASASEIVAGCLQDHKRAVVVGERTFGKGSVQSVIEIQDGTALRLTTAKYYTPSHKVIHEQGSARRRSGAQPRGGARDRSSGPRRAGWPRCGRREEVMAVRDLPSNGRAISSKASPSTPGAAARWPRLRRRPVCRTTDRGP